MNQTSTDIPTPRTDLNEKVVIERYHIAFVYPEFARTLERENFTLREELKQLRSNSLRKLELLTESLRLELLRAEKAEKERDELKAEVKRLKQFNVSYSHELSLMSVAKQQESERADKHVERNQLLEKTICELREALGKGEK